MKVIFTHKNGRQQEMNEKDAKLLAKVRRGTYQTRDMVAESTPPPSTTQPESSTEARDRVLDQITQAVTVEVDSSGIAWNADLHTATKIKNQDGTWRKRPGAKAETVIEGDQDQ